MHDLKKLQDVKIDEKSGAKVLSTVFEVSKGRFGNDNGDGSSGFSSFSASVQVKTLLSEIKTYEDIISQVSDWPVSQIIQREVDDKRTTQIAKKYILQERDKIKYFPPITVVLLPRTEDGKICSEYINKTERKELDIKKIIDTFSNTKSDDHVRNIKEFIFNAKDKSVADSIFLLDVLPIANYSLLSWNPEKYYAVVIDGQHRLMSLKKAAEIDPKVSGYYQDVVFVDIAEKSFQLNESPINIVRKIFVDVNNNSVPINKARLYVMDDKDIAAKFVQILVNDENYNNERDNKFIYPQLIDWHSTNLKHELPHLTSIILLYQLISDYVLNGKNLVKLDDLRAKSRVSDFKDILKSKFLVDERIAKEADFEHIEQLETTFEKFKEEINDSDDNDDLESCLFDFDYDVFNVATKTFEEVYVEGFVRFFHEILPYRKLVELYCKEGAFNKGKTLSKSLTALSKKRTERDLEVLSEFSQKVKNEIGIEWGFLFSVVGQKSLFKTYWKLLDRDLSSSLNAENSKKISSKIIKKLNLVFEIISSHTDVSLFGIFRDDDKKISDNTLGLSSLGLKKKSKYGTVSSYFWDVILYQGNSIIYNTRGVDALSSVLEYIISFTDLNREKDFVEPLSFPQEFKIPYLKNRVENFIYEDHLSNFDNDDDKYKEKLDLCLEKILEMKKLMLDSFLEQAVSSFLKNR